MMRTPFMIAQEVRRLVGASGFVYLASPYTKLAETIGLSNAARIVSTAAGALMNEGLCVFSPIAHGHMISDHYPFDKKDHSFWMDQCWPIAGAASICVVLKLDGWITSSGVKAEVEFFLDSGLPVIYVDPSELGVFE